MNNQPELSGSDTGAPTRYLGAAAALVTIVTVEAIRVFITLEYGLREDAGTVIAGVVAIAVFLAPFLAAILRRVFGATGALAATVCLVAIGTVLMQAVHPIPIWIAALTTAVGLIALTLLLHCVRDRSPARGSRFAIALVLGLMLDTALQAVFATWGPLWRTGGWAVLASVVVVLLVLASLPGVIAEKTSRPSRKQRETILSSTLPILALGPLLMLELSFAQDIAFADATYGTSLLVGTVIVLAADTVAIALMMWGICQRSMIIRIALGLVVVALSWLMTGVGGPAGVIIIVALGVLLGPLLAGALSVGAESNRTAAWRTAVAAGIGMTLFAVLSLAFQVDITNPLPFSGRWVPVAAAVLVLAFAGWPVRGSTISPPWRLIVLPVVLLVLVPLVLLAKGGAPALAQGNGKSLRILDWNTHSMVNSAGMLDPEAIAAVIERQHADVVTLQEVTRGWLIAGATDEAEWLARRLHMSFAWSPAADSEFGNLLLSRYPIVSSQAVPLPYVDGPQHRSFVVANIDIGDGTVVRVIGAHLESNTARTHRTQVETMLAYAGSQQPTIIAGDMNMQPTEPDVPLFGAAGFHSAQDTTGNSALSSATNPNFPGDRVDWIFGTKDVTFSDFHIVAADASDHRPLEATATVM